MNSRKYVINPDNKASSRLNYLKTQFHSTFLSIPIQTFSCVDHECDAFFVFATNGSRVRPKLSGIFQLVLIDRSH